MTTDKFHPIEKKISYRCREIETKKIAQWIVDTFSTNTNVFSKEPDTIEWLAGFDKGAKKGKTNFNDLSKLSSAIDENPLVLKLNIYLSMSTPNLGLSLIPEEYFIFHFDFRTKIVTISVSNLDFGEYEKIIDSLHENIVKANNVDLPLEHDYLMQFVDKLIEKNAEPECNIFLIMRFNDEKLEEIYDIIQNYFKENGYNILRADQYSYTDDLWDNVMTYMYGCKQAIAVFDQINYREFNPNIALEVGFMLSLRKRVLLLKDKSIPNMPTDIIGKIYRPFDTHNLSTVTPQLKRWLSDIKN